MREDGLDLIRYEDILYQRGYEAGFPGALIAADTDTNYSMLAVATKGGEEGSIKVPVAISVSFQPCKTRLSVVHGARELRFWFRLGQRCYLFALV